MRLQSVHQQSLSAAMPIIVGYFPIGMAFGVYAVTAGLDWYWPVLIGLIQYSGAAQFFLVALLAENTAPLVILGTLLVLNMRHVFYGLLFWTPCPRNLFNVFWRFSGSPTKSTVSYEPHCRPKATSSLDWILGLRRLERRLFTRRIGRRSLSIPATSLGFSLTALFVILVIEQWRAHRTMLPIAVSILAWFAVTSFGPNLSVGMTILSVMSFAMIGFAVIHWWQRSSTRGHR